MRGLLIAFAACGVASADRMRATFEVPATIGVSAFGSPTAVDIDGLISFDVWHDGTSYDARISIVGEGFGINVSGNTNLASVDPVPRFEIDVSSNAVFGTLSESNTQTLSTDRRLLISFADDLTKATLCGPCAGSAMRTPLFLSVPPRVGSPVVFSITAPEFQSSTLPLIRIPDGDFDGDNLVGFADFLILSRNFNATGLSYFDGDIDRDNAVTFVDFLMFSDNFGLRAEATSTLPVPEPAADSLLVISLLPFWRRRR